MLKVISANDNIIRKFDPYFIESSNIGKPSESINLPMLLNLLHKLPERKDK